MAHRTTLVALLGLLGADASAAVAAVAGTEPLRVLDALVRDIESDVERIRQQMDELLGGADAAAAGRGGADDSTEGTL